MMIFIFANDRTLIAASRDRELEKGLMSIDENLPVAYLKNNAINVPFCPRIGYHLAVNKVLNIETFINYRGESMPVDDLFDALNFLKDKFAYIDDQLNINAR